MTLPRYITSNIESSLKLFPAVLLNGARQVGKSTVAKQLVHEKKIAMYVSLDDVATLQAAQADPQGFISQFSSSVVIDEVQRAPSLVLAIKQQIDSHKEIGKFLLTGSANILSYPGVGDSLAGRMSITSMEGLSFNELMGRPQSRFIDEVLGKKDVNTLTGMFAQLYAQNTVSRQLINECVFFGSFPEVVLNKHIEHRNQWFSAYVTGYIERDIRDLSKFIEITAFGKLLRIAASRTGNLLNNANLGNDINLDQRTVARYIEMLEMSFQVTMLRPWYSSKGKSYVKTPKIFVNDAGLASYFCGLNEVESVKEHQSYGNLLETWVFSELRKALAHHHMTEISFYRNHRGVEVDFMITKGNKVVGIECKSSATLGAKDYKNLQYVSAEIGEEFLGIILYGGDQVIKVHKNIIVLPLGTLFV